MTEQQVEETTEEPAETPDNGTTPDEVEDDDGEAGPDKTEG